MCTSGLLEIVSYMGGDADTPDLLQPHHLVVATNTPMYASYQGKRIGQLHGAY